MFARHEKIQILQHKSTISRNLKAIAPMQCLDNESITNAYGNKEPTGSQQRRVGIPSVSSYKRPVSLLTAGQLMSCQR
jgi:hypothetical protein